MQGVTETIHPACKGTAMKINLNDAESFGEALKKINREVQSRIEALRRTRIRLSENTCLDEVLQSMGKTERKLGEQLAVMKKLQASIERITALYAANEEEIESRIDNPAVPVKQRFALESKISSNTEALWRVK